MSLITAPTHSTRGSQRARAVRHGAPTRVKATAPLEKFNPRGPRRCLTAGDKLAWVYRGRGVGCNVSSHAKPAPWALQPKKTKRAGLAGRGWQGGREPPGGSPELPLHPWAPPWPQQCLRGCGAGPWCRRGVVRPWGRGRGKEGENPSLSLGQNEKESSSPTPPPPPAPHATPRSGGEIPGVGGDTGSTPARPGSAYGSRARLPGVELMPFSREGCHLGMGGKRVRGIGCEDREGCGDRRDAGTPWLETGSDGRRLNGAQSAGGRGFCPLLGLEDGGKGKVKEGKEPPKMMARA